MIRVALYYPMRIGLWRSVVRGVFQYARPTKPWAFSMAFDEDPRRMLRWRPDAIIGQIETPRAVDVLSDVTVPVIDTSFSFHQLDVPRVRFDDEAIGRMAARYFLSRGYRDIAFVGSSETAFEKARGVGFRHELQRVGVPCDQMPEVARSPRPSNDLGPLGSRFLKWLTRAPRPLAVFAAVDSLALRLSEACLAHQIRVPEDVAILGVNNDELICNLASPPLSSVRLPAAQLGGNAARLLDAWLSVGQRPSEGKMLTPSEVVTRHSTDIYATADEVVMQALHFIRDHAIERISVRDVVESVPVSRSALERRFRAVLHRTPLDEIRRVQFQQAKRLLLDTNRTIPDIASASGFRDGKHLSTAFRRSFQQTPSEFRRQR